MAYWWSGDGDERYWVEIRKQPGHGLAMWSPTRDEDGGVDPWYELLASVRGGEVVYHWSAREHRFVGRSLAAGDAYERDGMYRVELQNFVPIRRDISLGQVRAHAAELYAIRDHLLARHGRPLYLPLQFKADRARLSFMSNYFAKLPRDMVGLLFGRDGLDPVADAGVYPVPRGVDPENAAAPAGDGLGGWRIGFLQPFRSKADTDYVVNIVGGERVQQRAHESLVTQCAAWLDTNGLTPGCNAVIDLGVEEPPVVIEAKVVSGSWPDSVRAAVGQLYEYRYFRVADRHAQLIFLADRMPPHEWIEYLERDRQIGVMWPDGDGFALSRRARRALRL